MIDRERGEWVWWWWPGGEAGRDEGKGGRRGGRETGGGREGKKGSTKTQLTFAQ